MSISQNFPDEGPSLNLNFASSRILDPRITFTRTSTGTYTDKNGLVTIAPTDTPRFDHSYNGSNVQSLGLLVEESRTNLLLRSEEFGTSPWSVTSANASVSANQEISPNGTLTADKLVEDTSASTFHRVQQSVTLAAGSVTYSVYLKAAGRNFALLVVFNGTNSRHIDVKFNLLNGTVDTVSNGSASITNVGNGWFRCSVTSTTTVSASNIAYVYAASVAGGGATYEAYTGDGTSGLYIWGAQLEAGAFPTSYIPTVASSVTRSTDNAIMTGTNFTSWYNSTEGTLFAAARINALGGLNYPGIAYVDDGTVNNCIGFYINDAGSDNIGAEAYISNVAQYGLSSSAIVPNQLNKVISAYKVNDFAAVFSMSGTVGTDASGSIPTVNRLIIGLLRGGNAPLNGTISQLSYYPKRLTNSQLQNLTK